MSENALVVLAQSPENMGKDIHPEDSFYFETCATCLFFRVTPTGGFRGNICRFWVPTATSINQVGLPLHMMANEPACGQWELNPNRTHEEAEALIEECAHG